MANSFLGMWAVVRTFCRVLFFCVLAGCSSHTHKKEKETVVVAAVLPMGGEHGHIGRNIANAMSLATLNRKVDVSFFDSDNLSDDDIKRMLSCDVILGPVDSASAQNLHRRISGKVPIVALSNNIDVAEENLFIAGHSPLQEMMFLLNYARQCAYDKYVIFIPEGAYGDIMLEACKRIFQAGDVRIVKYDFISADVVKQYVQEQDKKYCVVLTEANALPQERLENVTFYMHEASGATVQRADVVYVYNRKNHFRGVTIANFFAEVYGYAASELDLLAYDVMRYILLRKSSQNRVSFDDECGTDDWYPAQTGSFKIGKTFEREWVIRHYMDDGGSVDITIEKDTDMSVDTKESEPDDSIGSGVVSYSEADDDTIINDITEEYNNGNNIKTDTAS